MMFLQNGLFRMNDPIQIDDLGVPQLGTSIHGIMCIFNYRYIYTCIFRYVYIIIYMSIAFARHPHIQ